MLGVTSDSFVDYGCFSGTNDVVSFRNLRRDARLVVPCRGGQQPGANYAHLAAFVRTAPRDQVPPFLFALDSLFVVCCFPRRFSVCPTGNMLVRSVLHERVSLSGRRFRLVFYCFVYTKHAVNTHGGMSWVRLFALYATQPLLHR